MLHSLNISIHKIRQSAHAYYDKIQIEIQTNLSFKHGSENQQTAVSPVMNSPPLFISGFSLDARALLPSIRATLSGACPSHSKHYFQRHRMLDCFVVHTFA